MQVFCYIQTAVFVAQCPEIIVVFTVAELRLNFFQVNYQFPKSYGRKLSCLDLEPRV